MKSTLIRLAEGYAVALGKHLEQTSRAGLVLALAFGRKAVDLGLETLDLAKIHEQAMARQVRPKLAGGKASRIKRAGAFFKEANLPIEETHLAARQAKINFNRLQSTLGQRTKELADSKRQLERGVARHKLMVDSFAKNGKIHDKCLGESLRLQKRLRQLTHQVLAKQEHERTKISH